MNAIDTILDDILRREGVTRTPTFGSCSDSAQIRTGSNGTITVTMPGFAGPSESPAEHRRAASRRHVFVLAADGTLTDALGRRDALRLRHHVLTTAADAAAGAGQYGYSRQLRSELKMLSALSVGDLRSQADQVAQELRALDVRIQKANWEIELLD